MKLKKSIVYALVLALVLSISLVGCGEKKDVSKKDEMPKEDSSNTEKSGKVKSVKLQVWLTPQWKGVYDASEEGAGYESFFNFVAQEYNKEHSNVETDVQVISGDQRTEKLNVNLQSGTPPDIFFDSIFVLTDFAHRGALVSLDDIVDKEDKKDIPEGIWENCRIVDNIFFYPFNNNPCTLAYNADMFKQAGLDKYIAGENEIATWNVDEFKEILETLKAKVPDVYPLSLFAANNQGDSWNLGFLRMYGSPFFDDNQNIVVNDEDGVKALNFLKELYDAGLTNPGAESTSSNDCLGMFQNRQIAICFTNSILFNNIQKDMENNKIEKFDMRLANMPGAKDPLTFTYVVGACVFDTKDKDRIETAKDFVKTFSSQKPYIDASKNAVPVRKSVIDELKKENPKWEAYQENAKYMFNFSGGVPGYQELREVLYPELQAAFTGSKDPKQALDDYAKKGNEVLKKAKKDSVIIK
ncbi:ABC transporter substrate-binding protein [Xylanivirga thermophila]|uniref:ABC transporter substrate-binding protein n=1 Tax=Xylanivirga thermophila TaxID=2496273 RepID=UPI00101D2AE8|nr:extracellular solute-binding protein [Xylanivirga thermophila]